MNNKNKVLNKTFGSYYWFSSRPDIGFEEARKRRLFVFLVLPGIIVLFAFAVTHLADGDYGEGLFDLMAGIGLTLSLVCLRFMVNGQQLYRFNGLLLGSLFLFLLVKGGAQGSRVLWVYIFPLVSFFMLGKKEGFLWSIGLIVLSLILLHMPGTALAAYAYRPQFELRFIISYLLVVSLTYIYESARQSFQDGMADEHQALVAEKEKLGLAKKAADATNRALAESEAKLRSILKATPTGIGVVADQKINQVNQRLAQMLGYSLETLLDQSARVLYPDEVEYQRVGGENNMLIREKGISTVETRWRRKDGEIIDVILSSTPINTSNPSEGVTIAALEITERKKAEKVLRESEKLEGVLETAGAVAHELSQPLQIITGCYELMMMEIFEDNSLFKRIDEIKSQTKRLGDLAQKLLRITEYKTKDYVPGQKIIDLDQSANG
jgi:PAS domain S-box-containing protein